MPRLFILGISYIVTMGFYWINIFSGEHQGNNPLGGLFFYAISPFLYMALIAILESINLTFFLHKDKIKHLLTLIFLTFVTALTIPISLFMLDSYVSDSFSKQVRMLPIEISIRNEKMEEQQKGYPIVLDDIYKHKYVYTYVLSVENKSDETVKVQIDLNILYLLNAIQAKTEGKDKLNIMDNLSLPNRKEYYMLRPGTNTFPVSLPVVIAYHGSEGKYGTNNDTDRAIHHMLIRFYKGQMEVVRPYDAPSNYLEWGRIIRETVN